MLKKNLDMLHVFLDFEMNPTTNPIRRRQRSSKPATPPPALRMEIIEIGAVKLDREYRQIDSFSCYVRPEMNHITKKVTEITGITDETVADAVDFAQAMEAFVDWIGQEPVRVYAWSESDKKQLLAELRYKKLYDGQLPPNMRRWMDFQKVYTRIMGLSRSMSLSSAINIIDNDFEGHQHSALDDAANSAELLRLVKNKEQFAQKTAGIKKVFNKKDEPLTSSIGDLLAAELARLQAEENN